MPTTSPATPGRRAPDRETRATGRVPSADRLRGLAHPVRMRILAALRADGPSTATALAHRLGLNSGATSYHLRQLATYGFIVEAAEMGNRRDRFWLVDPAQEELPTTSTEGRAAHLQARLVEQAQAAQSAVESHAEVTAAWSKATTFETRELDLTPAQASALLERVRAVIDEVAGSIGDKGQDAPAKGEAAARPAAKAAGKSAGKTGQTRPFVIQIQGFPRAEES